MRGMERNPNKSVPANTSPSSPAKAASATAVPEEWRRVSSRIETHNRVFRLRHDLSVSPRTGQAHEFVVLEAGDWVSVVALTGDDRLVGIHQYRHGSGEVTLEIPGGLVEPGLSPLQAAQEELRQETGYGGGRWRKLGELNAAPALFSNRLHVFLAEGVKLLGGQELDEAEDITVELLDPDEVTRRVLVGEITHAQVVGSLYLWELAGPGGVGGTRRSGDAERDQESEGHSQ